MVVYFVLSIIQFYVSWFFLLRCIGLTKIKIYKHIDYITKLSLEKITDNYLYGCAITHILQQ